MLILGSIPISACSTGSELPAVNKIRVLLDTDANNELDDQHAIAYMLMNRDVFDIEGITVNRTRNGGDVSQHAAEAERIGLVNRVVPRSQLANATLEMASRLLAISPLVLSTQKDITDKWLNLGHDQGAEYSARAFAVGFSSTHPREAMEAFLEKREPRFDVPEPHSLEDPAQLLSFDKGPDRRRQVGVGLHIAGDAGVAVPVPGATDVRLSHRSARR